MSLAAVVKISVRRVRACDRFSPTILGGKFCACGWREWLHPRLVSCSSCGGAFEARRGETGFSHCSDHSTRRPL